MATTALITIPTKIPLTTMDLTVIVRLAPDLILLDVNEGSSPRLLPLLRTVDHTKGIPVIILCACPLCKAEEMERHLAELSIRIVTQPLNDVREEGQPSPWRREAPRLQMPRLSSITSPIVLLLCGSTNAVRAHVVAATDSSRLGGLGGPSIGGLPLAA